MSDVIVIIPTYNEKENVGLIIEAIFALEKTFDILIVDDNSPDGTGDIVAALQLRYNTGDNTRLHLLRREKKSGLGTAYIAGFKYTLARHYSLFIEMDADFSRNPNDLIKLYQACTHDDFDMSIGSRYVTGVNVINWSIKRVLMSYYGSAYVRIITGMPIRDTTAGFVCYRRTVLETIGLDKISLIGYGFQVEMKFLAWRHQFKIKEIPIVFTERIRGESKLSIRIFKEALWGIIVLKIKSWFTRV